MLNSETKRHIDAARQVLVGVVPNPAAQIDQITNALIYKFMADMDLAAVQAGGKRSFFTGELARYDWARLMDSKIGNQERMNLYVEALEKLAGAKQLPELFRNIFKSAFLPYRSPEVLGLFLKEIDFFDYSHSEELGNGYEYLLSIMSSQGDAGQFRTPRHIIDFIVAVVAPTKADSILDPACGTAGFLISAYKYILGQQTDKKKLTPDDKKKLMNSISGYDIDPGMVRIAQVNMYLHQFKSPRIISYDTLTMEERWKEKFDVILANPPFMSPKGGIRPHSRFSVQSNRSEVLFVDYIMNHLKPQGRAGIIVPEGIIFQSGSAYKQLRRNLVEDGLYAVVSLPGGVFNPYAGVKTSILFFNNELARRSSELVFVKVSHDGFDLGAQRRANGQDDLPEALAVFKGWEAGKKVESGLAVWVEKSKIAEGGDYNLSGERYRVAVDYSQARWEMVELGEVCEIIAGQSPEGKYYNEKEDGLPFYQGKTEFTDRFLGEPKKWTTNVTKVAEKNDILMSVRAPVGPVNIATQKICIGRGLAAIRPTKINGSYLFALLRSMKDSIVGNSGATFASINKSDIEKIKIPLPPLEVQEGIVAELDGYQKIIDGARQVVENWRPRIEVEEGWERVKLGEVCDVRDGTHDSPKQSQRGYPLITSKNIKDGKLDFSNVGYVSEEDYKKISQRSYVDIGDIIMPMIGTIGGACLIESKDEEFAIKNVALFKKSKKILPKFLLHILNSEMIAEKFKNLSVGATQKFVSLGTLRSLEIPLPKFDDQKQVIENIEAERRLVESNKMLIGIYEEKIKGLISNFF